MPGTRYAVALCNNCNCKNLRLLPLGEDTESKIVSHRFPKDEQLCKLWVQRCERGEKMITIGIEYKT